MSRILLTLFCTIVVLTSCISEDQNDGFSIAELERLLAADSAKTWDFNDRILGPFVEMCDQDNQLTFILDVVTEDSTTLYFTTGANFCSTQIDSIIYAGSWSLLESPLADTLLIIIDGDTNKHSIDLITSQALEISSSDDNEVITDSYSYLP